MATRVPLVIDASLLHLRELPATDNLNLSSSAINSVGDINSSGVITATKFVGDGSLLTGVASTERIITGTAATFNSLVDINGDLDVDGKTDLDDLSVAGVSTFAAAVDINNNVDVLGFIDVDGQATLDDLNVAGVSTFGGAVDINNNVDISGFIDVDGQTTLDDLNVAGLSTVAQLKMGSVTATSILDEDNMASNSATALATQQSIKAYVDNQVTAQDLDFQADSGGALSIDLDSETLTIAGTSNEIETAGSGNQVTIGLPNNVTVSGNLTVGGVLQYEDVVNVDSVGVVTARAGIFVDDSITHIGDTDTKIRFPGTDIFSIETGGSERVRVDSSGLKILDKLIHFGDTDTAIRFPGADIFTAETGGSERLRCDSDGVKTLNGRFYSAGTFAFIESSSTSHSTLTLRKTASGADAIDYLQLRDNSNALKLKIGGDGTIYSPDVLASHEGDTDTKIRFPAADTITAETGGTEWFRIRSNGNIGIGNRTSSPDEKLHVHTASGAVTVHVEGATHANLNLRSHSGDSTIKFSDGSATNVGNINYDHGTDSLAFRTNSDERIRIDSSGRLLVGHNASQDVYSTCAVQVQGTSAADTCLSLLRHGGSPYLALGATGGSSLGSVTALSSGDRIGQLTFAGADGTDVNTHSASIGAYVDGSVSSNTVPGRIVFSTSTGAGEPERMRITSGGSLNIGGDYTQTSHQVSIVGGSSSQLKVKGTEADIWLDSTGPSGVWRILGSTGTNTHQFRIFDNTGGADRLNIDSSGRVILGDTSVANAHANADDLVIGNTSNGKRTGITIVSDTDEDGQIHFSRGTSSGNAHIKGQIVYTHATGDANAETMRFYTDVTERFRLDSSGRLLLGRTATHASSSEKLSVNGMTSIQKDSTSTAGLYVFNEDTTSGSIQPFFFMHDGGGIRGGHGLERDTGKYVINGQHGLSFRVNSSGISGTERLFIDTSGRHCINTTSANSRVNINGGSSSNVVTIRNTTLGNGNVGILFSTQDHSGGREKAAIYHQETHGQAHYGGDFIFCLANSTGGASQVAPSDERMRITRGGQFSLGGDTDTFLQRTDANQWRMHVNGNYCFEWSANKRIRAPQVWSTNGSSMRDVQVESDGTFCAGNTSIRAAKKNIVSQTDVSWLYDLNPVTFNYRKHTVHPTTGVNTYLEETEEETSYGLIAEEVEAVKKDFCFYNKDEDGNDELSGVAYRALITPLLKALQDQKKEIDDLKTKVAALESS